MQNTTLSMVHSTAESCDASTLLEWILNGPPGTPEETQDAKSPAKRFVPHVVASRSQRLNPSALPPLHSKRNQEIRPSRAERQGASRRPRNHPAASNEAPIRRSLSDSRSNLSKQQIQRGSSRRSNNTALGAESAFGYSIKVEELSNLANDARQDAARRKEVRDALQATFEQNRVPTPQFAARRDLPQLSLPDFELQPDIMGHQSPWIPPTTSKRLENYLFHEPGPRVRESLHTLEELRGAHKRRELEMRHREEAMRLQWRCEAEQARDVLEGAASKVQSTWRRLHAPLAITKSPASGTNTPASRFASNRIGVPISPDDWQKQQQLRHSKGRQKPEQKEKSTPNRKYCSPTKSTYSSSPMGRS